MSDDKWVMHGVTRGGLGSVEELIAYVDKVGFLPLFRNEIKGFSVEEHTYAKYWWSGIEEHDPWEWRVIAARSERVAYGKFFGGKSGFVSLEWFPAFANYRRDGYDFDARWDDGLANRRCKKIMDCFEREPQFLSHTLKSAAGFGKGGEKNFSGMITALQMQTYLVIRDFRSKVNKRGEPYGMPVSVYTMPETLWGYDTVSSCYREEPKDSRDRIVAFLKSIYPHASEEDIARELK